MTQQISQSTADNSTDEFTLVLHDLQTGQTSSFSLQLPNDIDYTYFPRTTISSDRLNVVFHVFKYGDTAARPKLHLIYLYQVQVENYEIEFYQSSIFRETSSTSLFTISTTGEVNDTTMFIFQLREDQQQQYIYLEMDIVADKVKPDPTRTVIQEYDCDTVIAKTGELYFHEIVNSKLILQKFLANREGGICQTQAVVSFLQQQINRGVF